MEEIWIGVATSAYNEGGNLAEYYTRVKQQLEMQAKIYSDKFRLRHKIVIADNCSTDNSRALLQVIAAKDNSVHIMLNAMNYGGEPSSVEAIRQCTDCDLIIYMCSDLQDPPEEIGGFLEILFREADLDSVLATKTNREERFAMRLMRGMFYRLINYSVKGYHLPKGFHGFGAYRKNTAVRILDYWDSTNLTLRKCIITATNSRREMKYIQGKRKEGKTSFGLSGYLRYGLKSLIDGDAATSRIAFGLATIGVIVTILGAALIVVNYLSGKSGYSSGTPTILVVVCGGFTVNFIILALIARSLESGFRIQKRSKPIYKLISRMEVGR